MMREKTLIANQTIEEKPNKEIGLIDHWKII